MGEAYKLACQHCFYNQNVSAGVGFRYVDLREMQIPAECQIFANGVGYRYI